MCRVPTVARSVAYSLNHNNMTSYLKRCFQFQPAYSVLVLVLVFLFPKHYLVAKRKTGLKGVFGRLHLRSCSLVEGCGIEAPLLRPLL